MSATLPVAQALLGLVVFLGIAWAVSENRRAFDGRTVLMGLALQVILATIILKVGFVQSAFLWIAQGIGSLKDATCEGTKFVFGYLGGGECPFELKHETSPFIFAFQALPMVIVISAISMLLFHWKVLPYLVRSFSHVLRKTLRIGGALGVCCAAKVFLGQTEAPLLIRPYLGKVSRSELFTVMTAGMATTSASLMVLYGSILENTIASPISHILTASIISIPAAIVISRIMVPQTKGDDTSGEMVVPYEFSGSMDAVSRGAQDGLQLFLAVIAMLITMLALVKLLNIFLAIFPPVGGEALSLQRIFGYVFAPITWLMGIDWKEAIPAGNLLGTKTALNEVLAFVGLSELPAGTLSDHTKTIMTYALCGFANLGSIGIQIGTMGTLAPERRTEIISLGFKALLAGTIASCMSGTLVGMLHWLG
ncbi:MAG: nucleoside:proton symporter [Candidatus Puniceispirillum sp.]|nr:nucleoside:proton symporter [Candidatus Puniceispirillum sp.]